MEGCGLLIMKISILSKADLFKLIENNELTSNTAVVSFADEEDDFLELPPYIDVFEVVFYDIRPHCTVKEHYDRLLPEAKDIAEFVKKEYQKGKDIICQCDYGISRSAGLAAAIREWLYKDGISVFADYRYTPNQFVYNKVLKELNKENDK